MLNICRAGAPWHDTEGGIGQDASHDLVSDHTKSRLMEATLQVIRSQGLAGASARSIGAAAGVNQALIFYHFGTVAELIEAASDEAVTRAVAAYTERFAEVESLPQLIEVARLVHEQERESGNVAVMAQLLAGAQHDPVLARASRHAIGAWTEQVRVVLDRVLAATPAAALLDATDLAPAVSAAFIGIELFHGVDPEAGERAFATLARLDALITAVNDLGPVATSALRVAGRSLAKRTGG